LVPAAVAQVAPGTKAPLKVWRDRSEKSFDVTIGELPNERVAQAPAEASKPQGKLGVAVRPLSNEEARTLQSEGGLLVQQAKGPAAKAGLRSGDVIVAVNGQPTRTVDELRKQVGDAKGKLAVLIERQGQRVFVPVDIG
jgi:serine protease Do